MKKNSHQKYWGFDLNNIGTARPQDDFYQYANGGWIRGNTIPEEESRWGSFTILRYQTEQQLKTIVFALAKKHPPKKGSPGQLVSDVYRSSTDMKRRNALGASPLGPTREALRKVETVDELVRFVATLHRRGISSFWSAGIDQDAKNSDKNMLHLFQGGICMPDRDYYLKDTPEFMRVRSAYVEHIQKMLALVGYNKEEVAQRQRTIMRIETALAKASMPKEDTRDAEKTYHKKTVAQLSALSPNISWKTYLEKIGAKVTAVIVGQPAFLTAVSKLLKTTALEDLKTYVEWHCINDTASLLSEKFVEQNFSFYGTTLSGVKKMKPLWRRGLSATNGLVGEALGKLYIEKYFPASAKKAMDTLVSDLFDTYEARIRALDWMSAATKHKAVVKLRAMNRKIGYPKRFKTYAGLTIAPDDFFGNVERATEYEHRIEMKRLQQPVDRARWFMTPQTVNAYCHFNLNDIVFPAAILQFPFFDPKADDAINYGGIGAVIGHEMTHGFDDQGSKFDQKGNMKNWWTPSDKTRFSKKGKHLVRQFNSYDAAPGVKANGQLTLGENLADLGGLTIAYDAYQKRLKKTGRKNIAGLTPEQRFFLGFAQSERELTRESFLKTQALTDPHSVPPLRINGPVSNFPPFYEAFNVKKGDKLYRDAKDRVVVW